MAVLTVDASHLPVPLPLPNARAGLQGDLFVRQVSPFRRLMDRPGAGRGLSLLFQTSSAYRLGATIHAEMHGAATTQNAVNFMNEDRQPLLRGSKYETWVETTGRKHLIVFPFRMRCEQWSPKCHQDLTWEEKRANITRWFAPVSSSHPPHLLHPGAPDFSLPSLPPIPNSFPSPPETETFLPYALLHVHIQDLG
jgi:hypothetical protein